MRARNLRKAFWMTVLALTLATILVIPHPAAAKDPVIIFHAGSLTVPFAEMEKRFEAAHPEIDVLREAGGSSQLARMISELGKPADIMASADYVVIDKSLIPAHADWNIRFATNQMVLCYTETSRFAGEITAENWYDVLAREGVVWGHSDPNLDPAGYRSLMVIQLAEKFYNRPGLYDRVIANRPQANVRPKSVELVSLLKTGNMDYAWEYLSVAVQHQLKYLTLDDRINLGNYEHDAFYAQAEVKVTGKKPGTWITLNGNSVTYGVTLVKAAPNRAGALMFLQYLLDPQGGLKVLEEMGQPPFVPCRVPDAQARQRLDKPLQALVEVRP